MPRPCDCNRAVEGNYTNDQCKNCWKWLNSPWWRSYWMSGDLAKATAAPPRRCRDEIQTRPPCIHEGSILEFSTCRGDSGHVRDCDIHERCVRGPVTSARIAVCTNCPDYQHQAEVSPMKKWSYGVTTVPQRRDDLLPRTLASLKAGGFDQPRLFVDGCKDGGRSWEDEFGLDVTARGGPNLRTAGNWVCSMYELFYRDPEADYFALFQDDFVCSLGLRRYLEENPCPAPGYMNLYTFPKVQAIAPKTPLGGTIDGWFKSLRVAKSYSDQLGREVEFQVGLGAVALVFTREGVMDLLGSRELAGRPLDPKKGHRSIDGGIVHCMNKLGYDEYCHSPSLIQHTGERSSMGNRPFPLAESFRGEKFDLLALLTTETGPT